MFNWSLQEKNEMWGEREKEPTVTQKLFVLCKKKVLLIRKNTVCARPDFLCNVPRSSSFTTPVLCRAPAGVPFPLS